MQTRKIYKSIQLVQDLYSRLTLQSSCEYQYIFSDRQQPLFDEPQNFFYFSANNCQLKLEKPIKWPFSNGVSLCFWVYLEEQVDDPKEGVPVLFKIHSNKQGGGGIEAYFLQVNYNSLSKYTGLSI